ncbi:MAG TPA: hypothetical protein DCQ31_04910, partial [Bacteroidales bacterium]|nr:hypothetical protein [Bacteroidales bacterium]
LIKFKNEVVVSKILKKKTFCEPANYLLSFKIGNISAVGFNDTTRQAIIYPVLYRNTAIFDKKYLWYTGFDLEAWYNEKINYSIDLDVYFLTPLVKYWFTESKILLSVKPTERTNLYFGFKQVLENNPIGLQYRIYPLVELTYNFKLKKAKEEERGLFENEFYVKPKKKKDEKKSQ